MSSNPCGRNTLMVGDGLNDAPALAAGHASLSPASAVEISQTAADAVFQGEKLWPVVQTLTIARAAHRMALQNFAIAIAYNILFVPLAVTGHVTPLIAALAMSTSSILVTANAVRLRTMKLRLAPLRKSPMTSLAWLLPAAFSLGLIGLCGFLWALRNGQFDDLEGAGWRAIEDGEPPHIPARRRAHKRRKTPIAMLETAFIGGIAFGLASALHCGAMCGGVACGALLLLGAKTRRSHPPAGAAAGRPRRELCDDRQRGGHHRNNLALAAQRVELPGHAMGGCRFSHLDGARDGRNDAPDRSS